jgi:hypothetical protein
MKKTMNISAGFLLAFSIAWLSLGGLFYHDKLEIENEIKHRDIVGGTINKESALDKIEEARQTAREEQVFGTLALIVAGVSGALAVRLVVAGKDKDKLKK